MTYRSSLTRLLYPMGDRGGTATDLIRYQRLYQLYPMGDRGGTATYMLTLTFRTKLYPMGDRGGTATLAARRNPAINYTRWEIGGEPQLCAARWASRSIIPDGRSGGNRN